jgi:hypothetical protein
MKKVFLSLIFLGVSFSANASNEEVCNEAASKINDVVEDWYSFVKEYGAEEKNPSVLAMHRDYKSGSLKTKFKEMCKEGWDKDSSLFECFSGVRSEMGAAMCMHPDSNKNNWVYK